MMQNKTKMQGRILLREVNALLPDPAYLSFTLYHRLEIIAITSKQKYISKNKGLAVNLESV